MKSQVLKWIHIGLTLLTIGQVIWWAYLLNYHHALLVKFNPEMKGIQDYQSFRRMMAMETFTFVSLWLVCVYLGWRAFKKELQLQKAQSTFLGAISHELKTPLAIIRLSLETLARSSLDDSKKNLYLERANLATNKLVKEVDSILQLTNMSSVKTTTQKLSLNQIVSDCVLQLKQMRLGSVDLDIDLQENYVVRGSAIESRLILKNILENAIKYGSGKIKVHAENLGRKISLVVRDNGIGMTKEEIQNAFEPFWRSDRVIQDARPGTGVGLALARELSKKAGIQILLESDGLEKGTTTRIYWENCLR